MWVVYAFRHEEGILSGRHHALPTPLAPSILTLTPRLGIGSCPCVGDGLLGLVCVDPVYRELKLSPLYHLEGGIKEESRNMYFL